MLYNGGGVISDLLCYIVLYFSSLYIVFYLTLGACLNWRFTAQIQTWPSYQRHRRCTVIQQPPPRPCQAAVLLLTPWTDGRCCCRRSRCFSAYIVYAYLCCFTDKYSFKATRLSLSRLIADKLASSSHLVSLDKHKLSQSPFHRLLLAVVLTNTGYKLIFLEIRKEF